MSTTQIWYRLEDDDHLWAFYYYCKDQGDEVWTVTHPNGDKMLLLNKNEDQDND